MADIQPFRAVRYNFDIAGDVSLHVCPPFDVITPELQHELYDRSPYNIVRLELARRGLSDDPYERAAETAQTWKDSGVLKHDEEPSIYVTEEEFEYRGRILRRRGFIAGVRLEDYDQEVVLPHEGTRSEWVADRVRLMGAAQSNYSPLLVIYRDDLRFSVTNLVRAIAGGEPTVVFKPPDMPQLRMWRVTDTGTINVIQSVLRDSEIFIADGHHRYEAALRYRSAVRAEREVGYDESVNFRMMLLVSFDEPGLITRGYHRLVESATNNELADLVKSIEETCHIDEWDPPRDLSTTEQIEQFVIELGERKDDEVVFGLYGKEPGKFHIATMKSPPQARNALEYSEYSYLHSHVIQAAVDVEREEQIISPHHDAGLIAHRIDNGEAQMAFIMRPVPLNEFVSIVTRGWRLPAKTTNFFPKPPAGAVIQQF
ncbi:MAG: DUF1015 domain-containing protein [Dehalococcoidia bacterium]|jgi:uncharacterized protein (DUF1015 family)|nr:DUF1015 domain-containing protein [Dehalococcoidia bacterium]|tara:strand:- start:997 stop:2280 length:1284 start_codon:yes stop_codon:yes gene_type:complete